VILVLTSAHFVDRESEDTVLVGKFDADGGFQLVWRLY